MAININFISSRRLSKFIKITEDIVIVQLTQLQIHLCAAAFSA